MVLPWIIISAILDVDGPAMDRKAPAIPAENLTTGLSPFGSCPRARSISAAVP